MFGKNRTDVGGMIPMRALISWIWVAAPWVILILGSTIYRPGTDAGNCVPWRPTPEVYISAWVMLCLFLSISWILVANKPAFWPFMCVAVLFLVVISMCVTWLGVYHSGQKRSAIGVFVFLILFVSMLIPVVTKYNAWSGALLAPLAAWAVFQLAVSAAEISCTPAA
jgi:hypothetical protein